MFQAIMSEIGILCQIMEERHAEGQSWQSIADDYGVSKAMAYRIVKDGLIPKKAHIRSSLGLSPLVLVAATADIPEGIYLPVNIKILNCRSCQRPFIRLHPRQIYCDPKCRP